MKLIGTLFIASMMLMVASIASADPIFDDAKNLIDKLEPRVGHFWNVDANEHQAFTGAKVGNIKEEVDMVVGYGVNKSVIAALEVDVLKNLSRLPGFNWEIDWLELHAGYGAGYSWDSNDPVHGPVWDVSAKF